MRRVKKISIYVVGILVVLSGIVLLTKVTARRNFKMAARDEMEMVARLNTAGFEASMNEQLTLVLQLMRMPSVKEFMKNPSDPELRAAAFKDFGTFRDSFRSKSIFWISAADMEFWSDMNFSYVVDANDPDQYWFNMTMYETEIYNFNINYNPDLKVTNLWVNVVVRDEGKPIGIVGTGIPLTDMIHAMYDGIASDVTMYLYNDLMEITGALDSSILDKKISITSAMPHLKDIDAKPTEIAYNSVHSGEYVLAPIDLVHWHLVLYKDFKAIDIVKYGYFSFCAAFLAVMIMAALLVQILAMISQLTTLDRAVLELSSGDADLTKRVNITNRTIFSVFGDLINSQNKFIEKFQSIIKSLKDSEQELNTVGLEMSGSTENTATSIKEIIQNIETVHSQISQQSDSVHQTAGAVNQIASNIESLDHMIEEQSAGVAQASSAVEEMIGSISSVGLSIEKMSQSFVELTENAHTGVSVQSEVNQKIEQINSLSKTLQEANVAIASIAEQTNLLAMNAAIEAAHAGDAGKGFAVVADEIRKLSETSTAQSKTIGDQLMNIQASIEEVVLSSGKSTDAFNSVSDKIKETDEIVRQIKAAMEEQNEGSKQIGQTLKQMNESTVQVHNAAQEMAEGNKAILSEVQTLQNVTGVMQDSVKEMTTGASKIDETGQALRNIAGKMEDTIEKIGTQVGQFKV